MAHFFDVGRRTISKLWHDTFPKYELHMQTHGDDNRISFLTDVENFHNGKHCLAMLKAIGCGKSAFIVANTVNRVDKLAYMQPFR